ncbi:MAG: isoprenylcysteine carboxylmethyltransferase family protein [Bacteroidia bacterium]
MLASTKVKERLNPFISERYYRLFFNAVSVIGFGAVVLAFQNTESFRLISDSTAIMIAGAILLLLGLIVGFLASRQYDLGEFSGLSCVSKTRSLDQELKVEGINAWVRHPLYLSLLLLLFSWFCFSPESHILTFNIVTLLYVIVGVYYEEKKLVDMFGEAYVNYRKSVKMLVPYVF